MRNTDKKERKHGSNVYAYFGRGQGIDRRKGKKDWT